MPPVVTVDSSKDELVPYIQFNITNPVIIITVWKLVIPFYFLKTSLLWFNTNFRKIIISGFVSNILNLANKVLKLCTLFVQINLISFNALEDISEAAHFIPSSFLVIAASAHSMEIKIILRMFLEYFINKNVHTESAVKCICFEHVMRISHCMYPYFILIIFLLRDYF